MTDEEKPMSKDEAQRRARKKLRKRRRRPNAMSRPLNSTKNYAFTAIALRVEHYAFLRELREYYVDSMAKILGTLVVNEYLRILKKVDPLKAGMIKREYESEKHRRELVQLAADD